MIWITKVHFSGSTTTLISAIETKNDYLYPREIAKEAISGYGVNDIDHVEVINVLDKDLRNWKSFNIKTILDET